MSKGPPPSAYTPPPSAYREFPTTASAYAPLPLSRRTSRERYMDRDRERGMGMDRERDRDRDSDSLSISLVPLGLDGMSEDRFADRDRGRGRGRLSDSDRLADRDRDRESREREQRHFLDPPIPPFAFPSSSSAHGSSSAPDSSASGSSSPAASLSALPASSSSNPGQGLGGLAGGGGGGGVPRSPSQASLTFRSPFLAPSSRPTSSLWSPPSYGALPPASPSSSPTINSAPYSRPAPRPSTRIHPPSSLSTAVGLGIVGVEDDFVNGETSPDDTNTKNKSKSKSKGKKHSGPFVLVPPPPAPPRSIKSYLVTLFMILLGIAGAAMLAFSGWVDPRLLDESRLCLVLDDTFSSGSLDGGNWVRDVEMPWSISSGYTSVDGSKGLTTRRGGFEMTTSDDDNLLVGSGGMRIIPTLHPDPLTLQTYVLPQCTSAMREGRRNNTDRCTANANPALGLSLPLVRSARVHSTKAIRYGKVTIKAQMPRGDWLVPSIQLLPSPSEETSTSNPDPDANYPLGGVIDLLQARGNAPSYSTQGLNYVTSSLSFGSGQVERRLFGWFGQKRMDYSAKPHEYTLEWTEEFVRVFVDGRLKTMLDLNVGPTGLFSGLKKGAKGKALWDQANFPDTTLNSTTGQVVSFPNPHSSSTSLAPFDKKFYLSIHLGVGGTDGWFPDGVGDKPWFDSEARVEQTRGAMTQFAKALSEGKVMWEEDKKEMKIERVRMWEMCK